MKTVDKAMTVLDQFSVGRTELGLSELSRMAGLDKAATRRLLLALAKHGFVEQLPETRKYRLGQGFLRLARIREATVPVARAAQEVCDWMCDALRETVHISVPGPVAMTTIAHRMPNRAHLVNISAADPLPYHATASGLAFLSAATAATVDRVLALPRRPVTGRTLTQGSDLIRAIAQTRERGYGLALGSFEEGVSGIAMPFGAPGDDPIGTVAIAMISADMTDARRAELIPVLQEAVARMERAVTGV